MQPVHAGGEASAQWLVPLATYRCAGPICLHPETQPGNQLHYALSPKQECEAGKPQKHHYRLLFPRWRWLGFPHPAKQMMFPVKNGVGGKGGALPICSSCVVMLCIHGMPSCCILML